MLTACVCFDFSFERTRDSGQDSGFYNLIYTSGRPAVQLKACQVNKGSTMADIEDYVYGYLNQRHPDLAKTFAKK